MTQEQIKAKAKEYFPNDEFKQQIVIDAINWATKELQKENAELKAKLKEHESIGNAQFWENVWSWKTKADQLTKAKELLKEWLQTSEASGCDDINIVTDTEQFLSEVEK